MAESNQLNQGLTHIFQNLWGGKYRNKAVESQCDKPHLFPAIKPAYGGQKSSKSTTWMLQQALLTLTTTERWGFVQINLIKSIQPNKKQHILAHYHDVQFSCAINQPLLAHHLRVHQCLLTPCSIAPSIPWGVRAPGGKMLKQLLKDHNFLNNSPIFIIENSTLIYLLFKKHCIQYISIWKVVLDLVNGTWHHNFMAGCGFMLWANTCRLWSGIKSWPGSGCLQQLVRRSFQ